MSKSLGNHFPTQVILEKWHPEVIKLAILAHHYRSNINFSHEVFHSNRMRLLYFYETLADVENMFQQLGLELKDELSSFALLERFSEIVDDDFHTPKGLVEMGAQFKKINEFVNSPKKFKANSKLINDIYVFLKVSGKTFGIFEEDSKKFIKDTLSSYLKEIDKKEDDITAKIEERKQARLNKDFQKSDAVRDQLLKLGIQLKDQADGSTRWTLVTNF